MIVTTTTSGTYVCTSVPRHSVRDNQVMMSTVKIGRQTLPLGTLASVTVFVCSNRLEGNPNIF